MVRFSVEEFNTMVTELLYSDPVSFDMLYQIANKTLRPKVFYWCSNDPCLRGRGYEDDIIQEIQLKLIKTTVDYFLLRDGVQKPYNNDPEGFEDWMYKVANNVKCDFAAKIRSINYNEETDEVLPDIPSFDADGDEQEARIDRLKEAFSIVLSNNVNIYKLLTWLAQFVLMLDADATKIKSNEMIIEAFENKTLYEMYSMILNASTRIPWFVITETQDKMIRKALRKKHKGSVSYGETKYKEFFMVYKGKKSGKKSISDWVNRVNDLVRKHRKDGQNSTNSNKK